jgi:uncharacterized protein DUF2505
VRVANDIHYPADPAAVFAMLTDKAFQDRKLGQTGALSWDVEIRAEGGGAVVSSRRALPTDQVPDAFRALVGAQITITQTETWGPAGADGARTGTLVVEVSGAPIRMNATLSLTAEGSGGTVERVDGELKARVPLIGGKIERSAEPAVRAAIDAEERIGQAWLAER